MCLTKTALKNNLKKSTIKLVGMRGFEPPAPASRTMPLYYKYMISLYNIHAPIFQVGAWVHNISVWYYNKLKSDNYCVISCWMLNNYLPRLRFEQYNLALIVDPNIYHVFSVNKCHSKRPAVPGEFAFCPEREIITIRRLRNIFWSINTECNDNSFICRKGVGAIEDQADPRPGQSADDVISSSLGKSRLLREWPHYFPSRANFSYSAFLFKTAAVSLALVFLGPSHSMNFQINESIQRKRNRIAHPPNYHR